MVGNPWILLIFLVNPNSDWRQGSGPLLPVPRFPDGCLSGQLVSAQGLDNPCGNACIALVIKAAKV